MNLEMLQVMLSMLASSFIEWLSALTWMDFLFIFILVMLCKILKKGSFIILGALLLIIGISFINGMI